MTITAHDPHAGPLLASPRTTRLWKYLFFTILAMNVVIVGRDVIPRIQRRLERQQMACKLDDQEYLDRVLAKAREQMSADATVPISDQSHLSILASMRSWGANALAHSWPHAMLAKGIVAADVVEPNDQNIHSLRTYYDRLISSKGEWQEPLTKVDQTMHGPILLYLAINTQDERYQKAADAMVSYLLDRTEAENGTLPYRASQANLHLADTLGMICPFLAEYGRRRGRGQALNVAVEQLQEYIECSIEPRTGLPFHGYCSDDQNRPCGFLGWGRGTGWYGLGLVDTLPHLEKTHPKRRFLEESLKGLARSLRRYQRSHGGWNAVINVDSPYDSSATAMLTYVLQQGVNQEILGVDYTREIAAAMDSLKCHTRENGTVDFAQGDRMSLANPSTRYEPAPYAQGMVVAVWATQRSMK